MGQVKIIDRYIGRSTAQGFLLVLSLLVVLFSLFELLAQLDSVGKGTYRMVDAFAFVALTIPKRLAELTPMAGLIGSVAALGLLADHHELTAMQVAGLSARHIALAVLSTSFLLMLAAGLVSEFVAPPLEQYARTRQSRAIFGNNIIMPSKHGFWVRHGHQFVHVGRMFAQGVAADIEVFEFDSTDRLRRFVLAKQGAIQAEQDWVLFDAEATVFTADGAARETLPEYALKGFLSPDQVTVLELPPDSQSLSELYAYILILERGGQNAERYALAFWQKALRPVTTSVMVLLSLTFIFGPTRVRNAWQRIFLGALMGTLIYLMNQICGQLSLVLHFSPLLMTLLPAGIVLAVALKLLRRVF